LHIVRQTQWRPDIAYCLDRHNGGQTLHIVRQTQWRPDIADFETYTSEAGQFRTPDMPDAETDTAEARHCRL